MLHRYVQECEKAQNNIYSKHSTGKGSRKKSSIKTLYQVLVCVSVGFLLVVPLVFPSHGALQNAAEFVTESSATAVAVD